MITNSYLRWEQQAVKQKTIIENISHLICPINYPCSNNYASMPSCLIFDLVYSTTIMDFRKEIISIDVLGSIYFKNVFLTCTA